MQPIKDSSMFKKLLFALPPVIFFSLIIGIYSIWVNPNPSPTPTLIASLTPSPSSTSYILPTQPLGPDSPTEITEVSPVSITSTVDASTLPSPSDTPTPTDTLTPTRPIPPTSTPIPLSGVVIANKLNVRKGPSLNYNSVGGLIRGDKIVILRRTLRADWLEIKMSNGKVGWVATEYIEISPQIDIALVPMATVGPTPTLALSESTPIPPDTLLPFDLRDKSISGKINAKDQQWYFFTVIGSETVITLMFTPNVNFVGANFLADNVQFFVYNQNQIPVWPPPRLDLNNVGVGSRDDDRDGDYTTGELVWRDGALPIGGSFYLRIVNQSSNAIRYCLAPRDQYQWDCN